MSSSPAVLHGPAVLILSFAGLASAPANAQAPGAPTPGNAALVTLQSFDLTDGLTPRAGLQASKWRHEGRGQSGPKRLCVWGLAFPVQSDSSSGNAAAPPPTEPL